MHRIKRNRWLILPIAFFLAHPICGQALENAADHQQDAKAQMAVVLTLDDVINLALRGNRSLISSSYGVKDRELSLDAARSEFEWKLFPQATADATDDTRRIGSGVAIEKKFTSGSIAGIRSEIFRYYDGDDVEPYGSELGISLAIPLLRGAGSDINLRGLRAAQYSLRTVQRSHYLVKVNTVLEAVAAAYNIVQQRELVDLYKTQTARFQSHAVMAGAREKIGLATPIDVYRAQIRLKDAQSSLNLAREALRNAGDRLKIVLAAPLEQAVRVTAPLICRPVDISVAQAVETALQHRVELKQLDDDIEEAERGVRLSRNNLFPQVDLVTNYTRLGNDDAFNGITRFSEDFWSVRLVSETDWARSAEKATYRQSLLAVKRTKLNRAARIDTIKREVFQLYDALEKTRERMQIRNEQIDQAKGKLALGKIKFEHGMADNFDLIEAETELQEARTNFLAAQIEYIVGMYRLRATIGTLIES